MAGLRLIPLCLAAGVMASSPTAQPPPAPTALSAALWSQLQAMPWDAAYQDWHRAHPNATCRAHSNDAADATPPDGLWSYRCSLNGTVNAAWNFYAFDAGAVVVPRLDRFEGSVTDLPGDTLQAVADDLANRVSTRYGEPSNPASGSLTEFGSAFWRNVRLWQSNDLKILLYLDLFNSDQPRLGLLVRRRPLVAAIAVQDQGAVAMVARATAVDEQLARGVQNDFPAAAMLLRSVLKASPDPDLLKQAIMKMLDAAGASMPARRALLLLAADHLADPLGHAARDWGAEQRRLADHGLHFEWAELDGGWIYPHDLLLRAWTEGGAAPWAEQAFAELLARGWTTHAACRDGSDQFRSVVAQGEAFLRTHANAAVAPQVLLDVAQAYETWWSLSLSHPQSEDPDGRMYQDGAEAARTRAISDYEMLLRVDGATSLQGYARLALPRLKLGIDTDQRRFYCVYD